MAFDALMIVLLVLGFGFVIFFHELGHFLAAKWVGIKVEQFAVGFGQALIAWRKGLGFRVGTTYPEYRRRIDQYLADKDGEQLQLREKLDNDHSYSAVMAAEQALGLGETEYRLNWIPLGGYVKMLGQDDLKPNAEAEDPRAYNRKSVGARMIVVSAGVIMNIILAAIGFMIVFLIGFKVPQPVVGGIIPDSPAQRAGLRVGDVVEELDGKKQWDFTKVGLSAALLEDHVAVPVVVNRDGKLLTFEITPGRPKGSTSDFLALGIEPSRDLRGLKEPLIMPPGLKAETLFPPEELALKPGDVITQIDGKPIADSDFVGFDTALQESVGKPLDLTVRGDDGAIRHVSVQGHFEEPFSAGSFHLAGMVPRACVLSVMPESPAANKLFPGDVILSLTRANGDPLLQPSIEKLTTALGQAADLHEKVSIKVLRDGKEIVVPDLQTGMKVGPSKHGLGIGLRLDEAHPAVADVLPDTPASRAAIPAGATLTSIGQTPIQSWYDMHRALLAVPADVPVKVSYVTSGNEASTVEMKIDPAQVGAIHAVRYTTFVLMDESAKGLRKTSNPMVAASWGITETRDFVLQFYLTLRRMIGGSVSPANMMGPVGIFTAGTKIAFRGMDWLIWFLSMISANLAVVNFLPIPIVDGGLFTFLILEKIQGRPLSPKMQQVAQYVGLAFLAGVFLFVTYHDIARWF